MKQATELQKVYIGMVFDMIGWGMALVQIAWLLTWGIMPDTGIEMFHYLAGAVNHVIRIAALVLIFQGMVGVSALNRSMEECRRLLALKLQLIVVLACGSAGLLLPYTQDYLDRHTVTMLLLAILWGSVVLLWLLTDCLSNYLLIRGMVQILVTLGEKEKNAELMIKQGRLIFIISAAIVVLFVLGAGFDIRWVWDVCAIGEILLAMLRFSWQGYCAKLCSLVLTKVKNVST